MIDLLKVLNGVTAFAAGNINDMKQDLGPFNVTQEVMAQAHAFRGAFNQPGNVRQHKTLFFTQAHNSQHGGQGGKMIGRDFRFCRAHPGDDTGLAHAGITYQAHIRQQLQFQPQPAFGSRFPFFRKGRSPFGAGGIAGVPFPATSAFCRYKLLPVFRQVRDHDICFVIPNYGTQRNFNDYIFPPVPGHIGNTAIVAALRYEFPLIPEIYQCVQAVIRPQNHVAPPAAVATVGTAFFYKFLTAEAAHAVAAVTCFYINSCFINKHKWTPDYYNILIINYITKAYHAATTPSARDSVAAA